MLACLTAIPLAALCGSSLPTIVKAVEEGRLPTLAELRGGSGSQPDGAGNAPRFTPTETPVATNGSTSSGNNSSPSPASPPSLLAPQWPTVGTGQPSSAVVPARYDVAVDTPRQAGQGLGADQGSADATGRTAAALSPVPGGRTDLVAIGHRSEEPIGPSNGVSAPATSAGEKGSDPFTYVQDRLRQLGATYYLLESWGEQRREYRFYCRMAVGGNSQYTRSFWSIDNDPFRAMNQVLDQVEAWRNGRSS
jgi:hypothetical protein